MRRISDAFLAAAAMLFVISMAVMVTLQFRPLYYSDMEKLDIAGESGYSEEEIRENYDALIDYNVSPFQKELKLPTLPMSEEGEIHFREVKNIFQLILKLFIGSAVVLSIGGVWKNQKQEYDYLLWGGIVTIIIPLICGIFIAVNWENAFVTFHEIAFRNDYWLFDPATDPIIKILPDTFFLHCAQTIIGIVLVGAVGCFVLWWKKKQDDAKKTQTKRDKNK